MKGIVVITVTLFVGCSHVNSSIGLEDDNPIEQSMEVLIEEYSGLDIDLTP